MKLGFCLVAFVMGCVTTILLSAHSPDEAVAGHSSSSISSAESDLHSELETSLNSIPRTTFNPNPAEPFKLAIAQFPYGKTKSGETVTRFECVNQNGYRLKMINYGATITAFYAPDRNGNFANVVLNCGDIEAYQVCTANLGATIGIGCEKNVWPFEIIETESEVGVRFVQNGSAKGQPVVAEYTLSNDNDLTIRFSGRSPEAGSPQIFNRSYWNLAGAGAPSARNHLIRIDARQFYDPANIQYGILPRSVKRTAFDFRKPVLLENGSDNSRNQLIAYRHCWLVNHASGFNHSTPGLVAEVFEPKSGRRMEVLTNQPCLHLENGNELDGQPCSGGFESQQGFQLTPWSCPEATSPIGLTYALRIADTPFQYTNIYRYSVQP